MHLVCSLQKSWKEQKAGEGAEEESFWGLTLGQEVTQPTCMMFSSAVFGGAGFRSILCKKADAVNKKNFRSEAFLLENGPFWELLSATIFHSKMLNILLRLTNYFMVKMYSRPFAEEKTSLWVNLVSNFILRYLWIIDISKCSDDI